MKGTILALPMRLAPTLFLGAVTALILALTLVPSPGETGYIPITCIFCGHHASADAASNVILFLPLGMALAWWAPGRRLAWRLGPALSLAIELAQLVIPGRDASIGDALTNTLGTRIGWSLGLYLLSGAARPDLRWWPWVVAVFGAVVGVTLGLLGPAPTKRAYFGQWTPVLGQFEWYRGRVLEAALDRDTLPPRRLADNQPVRDFIAGTRTLHVRFIAGPRTRRLAPLVSVFDARTREIMVLGLDRDALVLRYRRRAADWLLDRPDLRFEGAARDWTPGDTLTLSVARTPPGACLTLGDATTCVRGHTPGIAWSLLLYPESFPAWLRDTLNLLWLAGLTMLVGWCLGTPRAALAVSAFALAVLWWLPPLFGAAPSPPLELAAAAVGLPVGVLLRGWIARAAQPATMAASTATQRSIRS